jgi:hypothetical protein
LILKEVVILPFLDTSLLAGKIVKLAVMSAGSDHRWTQKYWSRCPSICKECQRNSPSRIEGRCKSCGSGMWIFIYVVYGIFIIFCTYKITCLTWLDFSIFMQLKFRVLTKHCKKKSFLSHLASIGITKNIAIFIYSGRSVAHMLQVSYITWVHDHLVLPKFDWCNVCFEKKTWKFY